MPRTLTNPPRRRWKRVLAIAIVGGLIIAGTAVWEAYRLSRRQLSESRCDGHEQFVRSEWMDTTLAFGRQAIRGCMIDDLLARHDLRGLTRAQVVALIGEPPPADDLKEYDMVYWLGPERGLVGIDSEWLVIRLDSAGKVKTAELVTD